MTQGATSVSIAPNIGTVNASGSTSVSPTATTTYTLTATGPNGTVNQAVTVTVGAVAPGAPQIVRFEGSPLSIGPGGQTTLSWATNNATTVTITPNVGAVTANGSTTVSPSATTTYTLTATNSIGSVTAPVTITVSGNAVPQVVTFVANPSAISAGQQTKLCWQVTNASNIAITPGVGTNLNANDCATVSPSTTTVYTLTATNGAGQIQANATVTVGTVQILSFTANPPNSSAAGSPVVSELDHGERHFGGDHRRRYPADHWSAERQHHDQSGQQPNVHDYGLRTGRPDGKRNHIGVREVARIIASSDQPGGLTAARFCLAQLKIALRRRSGRNNTRYLRCHWQFAVPGPLAYVSTPSCEAAT